MERRHGELAPCAHMDALGMRFVPRVQGAAGMGGAGARPQLRRFEMGFEDGAHLKG